jgi:outer membrane lipoprotein-sorting protein
MLKQKLGCGIAGALLIASNVFPADAQDEPKWNLESALEQLGRQAEGLETAYGAVTLEWKNAAGALTRGGKGMAYVNREGELRLDTTEPDKRTILLTGDTAYVYEPARAIVEEFRLSQHPERLEPFALLGFSATGERLQREYLVTLLGEEVQGSQRLLGLELTPKEDEARTAVARMNIWVDQASWLPVRQTIAHTASGETLSINYTQMGRNVELKNDLFDASWPKGVESIRR